ncbi:FtsX-like permease family protein [Demequina sp. NBRC 110056]|uniref:FtsX-like permease family protein n=1 Tax=Demequina sp. NBRC 110056 TaxID=1570345 RepID=UPI000A05E9EB|nr:FtsX-like permease family protein [Demequina sp. NBRC 110056]
MQARTHKTIRDLGRQKAQVIAVAITIALGVMMYIATAGAFQNLSASYDATYDRLAFADLVASGGDTDAIAQAALDAGATDAITRTQLDPPMLIEETKLLGRVISIPSDAHPAVDDVDVIDGSYLDDGATDQVLLETHAADTFDIGPGDTVQIYGVNDWETVTVQGVVDSPEYLWPARSRQDILSDPHSFAVVFAPTEAVADWFGAPANQVLALLPDGASDATRDGVSAAMTDAGASSVMTQDDQPSNATLSEDLQGFDQMSVAFPALFLLAAGVAAWVLLTRRILQEKPVIGTLMAAGARRGRVLRHYLGQGFWIGLLGSVLGVALGVLANSAITTAYTGFIGVPDTVIKNYPWMIAAGLCFGAIVGVLGALGPAVTASRTAPAAAMRTQGSAKPPGAWSAFVARQTWLHASARMALRDLVRSKRRTFATMLGTVLALVMVLTSVGMMTSIMQAIDIQYKDVNLEDGTVVTQSGSVGADALAGVDGVAAVETTSLGQVTVVGDDDSYATVLHGFEPDTEMHGFIGMDGEPVSLPDGGVLAGHSIGDLLDVGAGDTITLHAEAGDTDVTIAAFLDEPIGTAVYATNDVAASALPDAGVDTFALAFDDGADRDELRTTITQIDGVVAYQDSRAIIATIDDYLGLFWVFIGVMIVLGIVLALAVMYVTMAVNVVERTGELATLRAAGAPLRKVAGAIATENMLATIVAIPVGLVLGIWSAAAFLQTFNDDLFTLELRWAWWTLPAAAVGVLLAALISQWPASRQIKKVDIAKVVRERAA